MHKTSFGGSCSCNFCTPQTLQTRRRGRGGVCPRERVRSAPLCVWGAFKGHPAIKHSAAEDGEPSESPGTVSGPAVPDGTRVRGDSHAWLKRWHGHRHAPAWTPTRSCRARRLPARLGASKCCASQTLSRTPLPQRRGAAPLRRKRRRRLLRGRGDAQSGAAGPGAVGGAGPALTRALDGARREGRRGGAGAAPGRGPAGACGRAAERPCVSLLGRASLGAGRALLRRRAGAAWGPCGAAAGPGGDGPASTLPRGQGPPQGCLQIETCALSGFICSGKNFSSKDRDLIFHFEQDLQEERRALKEDQKMHRSKAMKYLMETNRRRRAFEERQKEEEAKEQRFREQVLQQRKIKFQEATAKFRHAHQSLSPHKQTVQTNAAFQLEEALEQIKGSVLTPNLNKINFRTTDDTSSSSASRRDSFHQKQNSAMFGSDETIQESSRTHMDSHQFLFQKNLKEIQQLLEKQHLNSLENFHQEVKETDDSESLMSLDSLEAGEQNGNCTTQSESSFTTQCDCALYDPEKCQTRNNGLLHTDQSTSKNAHLNNCLRNVDLLHYHNIPIHDLLAKYNVLTPAEHANISEEESSASHRSRKQPAEFSTSGKQKSSVSNAFSFLQNRKDRSKPSSGTARTFATGHPVFNPIRAWDSPDSFPGEKNQDPMQDQSFKMTPQERTKSMQASSQPVATSVILFRNQGCSTGIPSTADVLPKDKNISTGFLKNTLGKMTETKEENIKCMNDIISETSLFQGIPNASVLLEVKQQNNKGGKGNIIETVSLLPDAEFNSDTPAQKKILKNNILERKRTKLFTSILKKDSKYEPSHFKAAVTDHGISFGTQRMSSIRDSLELAKIKKKTAENEKCNRKLKWCDQIDQIIIENNEKCYEKSISEISSSQLQCIQTANNAPKNNLSIVAQPSSPMFIKNHQENSHKSKPNVNTEKSNKEYPSQYIFTPTGSFSARKAWMVSKDEASKPPVCSNNPKIKEGGQLKNKAKLASRATSVRVQSRFMPKKRRGTMIQLQSATEANKTHKAPGKYLTPHPPSTPLPGDRSVENTASPGCQSQPPASLQATSASNRDFTDRHVVLASQVLNRNSAENSEKAAGCAGLVTAISTPDCSTANYKSWAKNTCSVNNVQASAYQDNSVTCSEKRPVNTENGLHLYHIPAAGKTSTFWHRAHSTQAPKDSATGGVPVTRQNQVFDNYENKHQAFSECRRQNVVSKIWKPAHHAQNSLCALQLSPIQSAFDPVQKMKNTSKSEEVSESTAQFLVAEKLASTPVAESKILAVMDHMKPASQPSLLKRALCPGRSALSIEEQKIFQSLDCLNKKLQNVQEAIIRNSFASHVLQ
ncbi:PREDICTED: centrosomal protein of 126 kDa [Sturnus vulgaris]|uniref:centrosomal protein of 126 kDa n=1 Tax=Sturnus vulgaris TaxID=9172 RepID=UPI00071A1813|nr:PREDICTED: centrosomal protein of 126 kDa [Sturnus vulgaris]